jgi:hypothetical protein
VHETLIEPTLQAKVLQHVLVLFLKLYFYDFVDPCQMARLLQKHSHDLLTVYSVEKDVLIDVHIFRFAVFRLEVLYFCYVILTEQFKAASELATNVGRSYKSLPISAASHLL